MNEPEIIVKKAAHWVTITPEVLQDADVFRAAANGVLERALDPNYVAPKPWEGEPLTPKPAAYLRLLDRMEPNWAMTRAIVELHGPEPHYVHPDGTVTAWRCSGCEWGGYDGEAPDWPCETTAVVARHLGVDLAAAAIERSEE